jgi:serine/threonine protein kinase
MPIRFPTVEPRVLRAVEELQELSKENQSLVRIEEVFKHGSYPAKRGGLRLGCAVVLLFVVCLPLTACRCTRCTLFVLMEYCSGGSLYDRIHLGKKLTPKEMYALSLQAAIAVSWLHRGGRSHDNICSRNFLFSDNTPKALLKVMPL